MYISEKVKSWLVNKSSKNSTMAGSKMFFTPSTIPICSKRLTTLSFSFKAQYYKTGAELDMKTYTEPKYPTSTQPLNTSR